MNTERPKPEQGDDLTQRPSRSMRLFLNRLSVDTRLHALAQLRIAEPFQRFPVLATLWSRVLIIRHGTVLRPR